MSDNRNKLYRFAVRITVIRFFELFITSAIISSFVTALNLLELVTSQGMLYVWTLIGTGAFLLANTRMLRQCYADLRGGILYYICNITAYVIFAVVGLLIYVSGANILYTWLFAITKVIKLIDLEMRMRYSLIIFHLLGIISVFASTIKMKKIFLFDNDIWDE